MVAEIRIYFEGDRALKPGFHQFLGELRVLARAKRCQLSLIDTRATPLEDLQDGIRANPHAWSILLMDSDGPVDRERLTRLGLSRPARDSVFWMVQVMESWFLADKDALARFYGPRFLPKALPQNPQVEKIPKADALRGLKDATRRSSKGPYHKTQHAPALLALIDPARVRQAAPHCKRLFDGVTRRLNSSR
jgi:hypothetical protein